MTAINIVERLRAPKAWMAWNDYGKVTLTGDPIPPMDHDSDAPRLAADEIEQLREQLEWDERFPAYDGIQRRDATIKMQDERIERLQAENAKLRKNCEAMAECKALADGMANMIRGFIFKTVERETLDEMAAKYRKWEEDYCHPKEPDK